MVKLQSFRQGPKQQKFLFLSFSRKWARGGWGAQSCSRRTEARIAGYTRPSQRESARETALEAIERLLVQGPSSKPKVQRLLTQLIKSSRSWQQLHHYLALYPQYLNHIHYTAAFTHLTSLPSRSYYIPTTHRPPKSIRSPETIPTTPTTPSAKSTLLTETTPLTETVHSTKSSTESAPASPAVPLTGFEDASQLHEGRSKHGSPIDQPAHTQPQTLHTPAADVAPDIAASKPSWPALGTEPGFVESTAWRTTALGTAAELQEAAESQEPAGSQEDALHRSSAWFVEPDSAQSSPEALIAASEAPDNLELPACPNPSEKGLSVPASVRNVSNAVEVVHNSNASIDTHSVTSGTYTVSSHTHSSSNHVSEGQYHNSMHEGTADVQQMSDKAGFAAHLSSLVATQLDDVDARGLANILWAHAVLQTRPADCDKFLDACLLRMGEFSAQHLCNLIWAMASLQLLPNQEWLLAFLQAASASFSRCTLQGLSQMLWGLATLEIKPEASWMSSLCQSCLQRLEAHEVDDCIPQTVSMTLWSLAKLNGQPDPHLLDLYLDHLLSLGWSQCTYQCISNIAWALGTLRYTPSPTFSTSFLEATHQLLTNISHSNAASHISHPTNISGSLPATRKFSGRSAQAQPKLQSHSKNIASGFPEDSVLLLSNVGWAVATLQLHPTKAWMDQYASACHVSMPSFSPQDFRNVAWSLVQLRYCPSSHWISHYLKHSLNKLEAFSPEGLALTSWSLARLYVMSRNPSPPAPPVPQASMSSTAHPRGAQGTTEFSTTEFSTTDFSTTEFSTSEFNTTQLNQLKTKFSAPLQSSAVTAATVATATATAMASTAPSSPTSFAVPGSVAAPVQWTPSPQTASTIPTTAIQSSLPALPHSTAFPAPVQYMPTTDSVAATSLAAPTASSAPSTSKSLTLQQLFAAAMAPADPASLATSPPAVTSTPSPPPTAPAGSPTGSLTDSLTGSLAGSLTGSLTDSVTGSLAGTLTGLSTASPTQSPTASPTRSPRASPTQSPTALPTRSLTQSPTASPTGSPTESRTGPLAGSPTVSISPAPSSRLSTPRKRGYVAAAVEPSKQLRTPMQRPSATSPKLPTQPRPSPDQTHNLPRQVASQSTSQSLLAAVEDAFRIDGPAVKRVPLSRPSTSSSSQSSSLSPLSSSLAAPAAPTSPPSFSSLLPSSSSSSQSSSSSSLAAPRTPSSLQGIGNPANGISFPVEQIVNGSGSSPVQLPNGVHVDQLANRAVRPPGQLVNAATSPADMRANVLSASVDQLVNKPSSLVDQLVSVTLPVDHMINGSSLSVDQMVNGSSISVDQMVNGSSVPVDPLVNRSSVSVDELVSHGTASDRPSKRACTAEAQTLQLPTIQQTDFPPNVPLHLLQGGRESYAHDSLPTVDGGVFTFVDDKSQIVNNSFVNGSQQSWRTQPHAVSISSDVDVNGANFNKANFSASPSKPDLQFGVQGDRVVTGGSAGMHSYVAFAFSVEYIAAGGEGGGAPEESFEIVQDRTETEWNGGGIVNSRLAQSSNSVATSSGNNSNSVATSGGNSTNSVAASSGNSVTTHSSNRNNSVIISSNNVSSSTSNSSTDNRGNTVSISSPSITNGSSTSNVNLVHVGSVSGGEDPGSTATRGFSGSSSAVSDSNGTARPVLVRPQKRADTDSSRSIAVSGQADETRQQVFQGRTVVGSAHGQTDSGQFNTSTSTSASPWGSSELLSSSGSRSRISQSSDRALAASLVSNSNPFSDADVSCARSAQSSRSDRNTVTSETSTSYDTAANKIWTEAVSKWLRVVLRRVSRQWHCWSPRSLSMLIWAVAKTRHRPEGDWMQQFLLHSGPLLRHFNSQDLSNTIWALSLLRVQPEEQWLGSFQEATLQLAGSMRPQESCVVLWSFASLNVPVSHSWLRTYLMSAVPLLNRFKPGDYAQCLWSLASLQHVPPSPWLSKLLDESWVQLPLFGPRDLSITIWSLAKVLQKRSLPKEWVHSFLTASTRQLGGFSNQAVVNTGWAVAVLRPACDPPIASAWLQRWLQRCHETAAELSPAGTCALMWTLYRLKHVPPQPWMQHILDKVEPKLPQFKPNELAVLLWGVHQTGHRPDRTWLLAFFNAAQAQLHAFPTKPASLIANALAQFDVELNQRWLACFVLVADDSIVE